MTTENESTERYYAEMEAARNQCVDHYFAARPQADTITARVLFKAAFERGFGKAYNLMLRPQHDDALARALVEEVVAQHPGIECKGGECPEHNWCNEEQSCLWDRWNKSTPDDVGAPHE